MAFLHRSLRGFFDLLDQPERLLGRAVVLILIVMGLRLGAAHLLPVEAVIKQRNAQGVRRIPDHPTTLLERGIRGRLLDRNGRVLAASFFEHVLVVDPTELGKHAARWKSTGKMQALYGLVRDLAPDMDPLELERRLFQPTRPAKCGLRLPRRYAPLASAIRPEDVQRVRDAIKRARLPGLTLEPRLRRSYPHAAQVAPLVGVVGDRMAKRGGKRVRVPGPPVGVAGLEKTLEKLLRATPGAYRAERDGLGREFIHKLSWARVPKDGADCRLSIDLDVQLMASEALEEGLRANHAEFGSAVVLDAQNADILACVSLPTVDPTRKGGDFRNLSCRALQARYTPGSTIKPLFLAWALAKGKITTQERFDCGGSAARRRFGARTVREYSPNPEPLNLEEILMRSSNVGAVRIAFERLGLDGMFDALEGFAFAQPSVDHFHGALAARYTSRAQAKPRWTGPGFPQGYEMVASPMTMACVYLCIANGGVRMRPRLVLDAQRGEERLSDLVPTVSVIPRSTADVIKKALLRVVEDRRGTGHRAISERYSIAGKSGTGEVDTPERLNKGWYNAWFCCFAPVEKPRIVVVVHQQVKSRGPGTYTGGRLSGPVAKRIVEDCLSHFQLRPDKDPALAGTNH